MKTGISTIHAFVFVFLMAALGTSHAQLNVVVEDTAREAVGGRLVYAIRERIRSSSGFKLVSTQKDALFRFGVVTLDEKSGYSTVYSVVFSAWQPETGTWTYLTNIVGTCGSSRITECADGLVADADKSADQPREYYRTYVAKDKK